MAMLIEKNKYCTEIGIPTPWRSSLNWPEPNSYHHHHSTHSHMHLADRKLRELRLPLGTGRLLLAAAATAGILDEFGNLVK
mmetsp:Transcript_7333/g.12150  ORF Transcript_7333/g.12150 Transcript_7333/m.12150 type:complete len:81 (+) Transcript_7333:60-302(+)